MMNLGEDGQVRRIPIRRFIHFKILIIFWEIVFARKRQLLHYSRF
jgi:hypothetical protein